MQFMGVKVESCLIYPDHVALALQALAEVPNWRPMYGGRKRHERRPGESRATAGTSCCPSRMSVEMFMCEVSKYSALPNESSASGLSFWKPQTTAVFVA